MNEKEKALLMTLAYQRQTELGIAISQLDQAMQMTQEHKEKDFLATQRGQMAFMHKELSEATKVAEES